MKRGVTIIGAVIGWILGRGPIGAIFGAAIGNFASQFFNSDGSRSGDSGAEKEFHGSLLVLASVVIKADGHVDERELQFVREHFKRWFGEERAQESFKSFKQLVQEKPSIPEVCAKVRRRMNLQGRIQLLNFLFGLALADGKMTQEERQQIARIAGLLGVHPQDFQRIEALHKPAAPNAYVVLGVDRTASDAEIKKMYRSLVKKYHPDALHGLGEDVVKEAEGTFRKIQQAYEQICQERGIK